jgi:tartrate-resistant acid phosphatase type 5
MQKTGYSKRPLLLLVSLFFACQNESFLNRDVVHYEGDSIPFAIIGDYGLAGEPALQVSQLVDSWNPSFIITTGDNNYPDGEVATLHQNIIQYYEKYIYNPDAPSYLQCRGLASIDQENRFFPSLGNHDYDNPIGANPYWAFFTLPGNEQYYDFVKGSVHFFCIESQPITEEKCCEHKQAKWLKEQLSQSTSAFNIVYMHHGPYTLSDHPPSEKLRWPYKEWGVDMVVYGHNHIYERFIPEDPSNPAFVVNGIGGSPYLSKCKGGSPPNGYEHLCLEGVHGAIKGLISKHEIKFELHSIDHPLEVLDQWTIAFN